MNFNIKLITEENNDGLVCINHGQTDEWLYNLEIPTGRSRSQNLTLCSGCLEAIYNITKLGSQFGMNEFSATEATITIPDKQKR